MPAAAQRFGSFASTSVKQVPYYTTRLLPVFLVESNLKRISMSNFSTNCSLWDQKHFGNVSNSHMLKAWEKPLCPSETAKRLWFGGHCYWLLKKACLWFAYELANYSSAPNFWRGFFFFFLDKKYYKAMAKHLLQGTNNFVSLLLTSADTDIVLIALHLLMFYKNFWFCGFLHCFPFRQTRRILISVIIWQVQY